MEGKWFGVERVKCCRVGEVGYIGEEGSTRGRTYIRDKGREVMRCTCIPQPLCNVLYLA